MRWLMIIGCFWAGFYFHNEIAALVVSGAPFDQAMIRALIRCRMYPEAMAILTNAAGKKCTIPLPPGSTRLSGGTYLTTTANFEKYLEDTLPGFGWTKITRLGEIYTVKDKNGYREFTIKNSKYAGVYRKVSFEL